MRIHKASILDIGDICEIAGEEMMGTVRNGIVTGTSLWFISPGKYAMCFENLWNDRYQMHIYSHKEARGKELKEWAVACGYSMIEQYGAKEFINFVPEDRKDLRMLMASLGSKKVGIMPVSRDIMYVSTKDMVK